MSLVILVSSLRAALFVPKYSISRAIVCASVPISNSISLLLIERNVSDFCLLIMSCCSSHLLILELFCVESSGFSKISVGGLIRISEDFDQEAQAFHSHFIMNTFVTEVIETVDGNTHGIHLLIRFLIGNQETKFLGLVLKKYYKKDGR